MAGNRIAGQEKNGMTEILAVSGKEFNLSLESNPSTGYLWEAIFDSFYLELVNTEYHSRSTAIGGGGVTKLKFMPKTSGKVVLEMRSQRPWEGEAIKIIRYEVMIS
jgi:inhibitor of cysteine peptidase